LLHLNFERVSIGGMEGTEMKIEEKARPFYAAAQLLLMVDAAHQMGWKGLAGSTAMALVGEMDGLGMCLVAAAMSGALDHAESKAEKDFRAALAAKLDPNDVEGCREATSRAVSEICAMVAAKAS
jgi:hypothetical protein